MFFEHAFQPVHLGGELTGVAGTDVRHLGKPGHPEVVEAVDRIVKAAAAAAVPLGTLTRSAEAARGYFEQGFSFVGIGTDTAILASALTTLARSFDPVATSL